MLTLVLMISFFVNRTLKLVSKDDPFFSMLTMSAKDDNLPPSEGINYANTTNTVSVELWDLKYIFAV